ncbi:MAG TPA: hypothetical protein VFQ06_05690, partial [Nitrospira sp.]|nr:hypothetical protein [Nitrospira sp.]
ETTLPADALYADMASERRVQSPGSDKEVYGFLKDLLQRLIEAVSPDPMATTRLFDGLLNIEPFSAHPVLTKQLVEELR